MNISAFPCPPTHAGGEYHPGWDGMTLRDYFAAAALVGYGSSQRVMDKAFDDWTENGGKRPICIAKFLAGLAYEVADEMLEARKQ